MRSKRTVAVVVVTVLLLGLGNSVVLAEPLLRELNQRAHVVAGSESEGRGQNGRALPILAYIAGKSGTPLEVLVEEFRNGKTLEEIAEENGVEWATIEEIFGHRGFDKSRLISRLEERLARLAENKSRLEELVVSLEDRIARLEERIPAIQDETMKGFAIRFLDILGERLSLVREKILLIEREIDLAREVLDYLETL